MSDELSSIKMEGYMSKKGLRKLSITGDSWTRRYFTLNVWLNILISLLIIIILSTLKFRAHH